MILSFAGNVDTDWQRHRIGHSCEACRDARRHGPKMPRNCLLTLMASAQGDVVQPVKDKKSLRNEQRRKDRLRARRSSEKRRLVMALEAAKHNVRASVSDLLSA